MKLLLEKGANVHADDDLALRWASEFGHHAVVKLLLEKGANVHKAVKLLLENGADVPIHFRASW